MKESFFSKNSHKIRVCEWGNENNPTIFCLHGLGSTALSFFEIAESLKNNYHIISIDLPGHGKSDPFYDEEDYGIPNLINLIEKIVDYLKLNNFYILAHSWGGEIALHYSSKFKKKVKKILLLDGGYHIKEIQYEYFGNVDKDKLGFEPNTSLLDEITAYTIEFDGYVFENLEEYLKEEKENYSRWSKELEIASKDLALEDEDGRVRFHASGETAKGALKSMYNYPTNEIYKDLDLPILLIRATLPKSWDEIRDILIEKLKNEVNIEVKSIDAGHLVHWDNPYFIIDEIKNWMK